MNFSDPQIETPAANALIVADQIYRDAATAKWILAGVFNRMYAIKAPIFHEHMAVFLQVTNVSKPVDLRLRIENADNGDVLLEFGGPITANSPLEVIERAIQLCGIKFPVFGKYWIQLLSREEILIQAPLYVLEAQPRKPDEPSSDKDI